MDILVTSGTGSGPTPLAAFDAALLAAGVANYNLIPLSSIIPPGACVRQKRFTSLADEYGRRLYVVIASRTEIRRGRSAWAGLGWTQAPDDGRGLFVEESGASRASVERAIHATLGSMVATRSTVYGDTSIEVVGVKCVALPACALALAVFQSEGWAD